MLGLGGRVGRGRLSLSRSPWSLPLPTGRCVHAADRLVRRLGAAQATHERVVRASGRTSGDLAAAELILACVPTPPTTAPDFLVRRLKVSLLGARHDATAATVGRPDTGHNSWEWQDHPIYTILRRIVFYRYNSKTQNWRLLKLHRDGAQGGRKRQF